MEFGIATYLIAAWHSSFKPRGINTLNCDGTFKISVSDRLPEGVECRLWSRMSSAKPPVRSKYSFQRNFQLDTCSTKIITSILLADQYKFLFLCGLRIWCYIKKTSPTRRPLGYGKGARDKGGSRTLMCVTIQVSSRYVGDSNVPVCGWNYSVTI